MPLKLSPTQVAFNARGDGTFRLPFEEQIAYLKNKLNMPTEHWDDLIGSAHDKSFVVAGALKADLLNDFHDAMNKMVQDGKGVKWFKKEFENIVRTNGWEGWTGSDTLGGRDWRARVIYNTNLLTSYSAGRYSQLTDPEMLKVWPYWKYVHDDRQAHPRPLHVEWGGTVLRYDDPWFQQHYPPQGYGCRCRIASAMNKEFKGEPAPDNGTYEYTNRDGKVSTLPKGVDYGWDYAPGKSVMEEMKPFVKDKIASLPSTLGTALQKDISQALIKEEIKQKAVKKAAKDAKEYVLTNGKETGVEFMHAYNENGTKVLVKSGAKDRITFTNEEFDILRKTNGLVLVHNHPGGRSLSDADFNMAYRMNGSIVAHGHNRVSYTGKVIDVSNFNDRYNLINSYIRGQLQPTIEAASLDNTDSMIANAEMFHHHILNETLASIGAVEYSTTKMVTIPTYIKKIIAKCKETFEVYKK